MVKSSVYNGCTTSVEGIWAYIELTGIGDFGLWAMYVKEMAWLLILKEDGVG